LERKAAMVSFRIDLALKAECQRLAEEERETLAQILRKAVLEYVRVKRVAKKERNHVLNSIGKEKAR